MTRRERRDWDRLQDRWAAGEPLTNDILKCQLEPAQRSDYPAMTDPQFGRLQKVFATGVCAYSKPGVGYQPLAEAWLIYTAPGKAHAPSPVNSVKR